MDDAHQIDIKGPAVDGNQPTAVCKTFVLYISEGCKEVHHPNHDNSVPFPEKS